MNQLLKEIVPNKIRCFFRRLYFLPVDFLDFVSNKRPFGVPPGRHIMVSSYEYLKKGERTLGYCRDLAGLKPWHAVLEIGCGTGNLALALAGFLTEKGIYDGYDASEKKINWCNKNIAKAYPNFKFRLTSLLLQSLLTSDQAKSGKSILQNQNDKYDFVFINSVFTRTLPAEIDSYLTEISSIMKPGAVCMMYVYIVNCESEDMMIKRPARMHFPANKGFYRVQASKDKSLIIAYDEEWLLDKLEKSGFEMTTINYGKWCGRSAYFEYKDMLLCCKL